MSIDPVAYIVGFIIGAIIGIITIEWMEDRRVEKLVKHKYN